MRPALLAAVTLALTLACGGGPPETPPAAAPEAATPAATPAAATPAPAAPVGADEPAALVLRPSAGGCAWDLWRPTGTQAIRTTPGACPTDVAWTPDFATAILTVGDGFTVVPRTGAPTHAADPYGGGMGNVGPWVADGQVWLGTYVNAEVDASGALRGDGLTAPAADGANAILAWTRLDGGQFVPDGAEAATFLEFGPIGAPSRTPATMVVFRDLTRSCSDGAPCEAPEGWASPALRSTIAAAEDEGVGFVPAGSGGFVFRTAFGDSLHAMAPVFWCPEATCAAPVRIDGVPEDQVEIALRGGYALVGVEYGGAQAVIVRVGDATPVARFPDAALAAWAPAGFAP